MLVVDMELPALAESELLEEGLDTLEKLVDYLGEHDSFESINGIGPVSNKAIFDAMNVALNAAEADQPESVETASEIDSDEAEGVVEDTQPAQATELHIEATDAPESPEKPKLVPSGKVAVVLFGTKNQQSTSYMKPEEVDNFWRMNRKQWRSYEAYDVV